MAQWSPFRTPVVIGSQMTIAKFDKKNNLLKKKI